MTFDFKKEYKEFYFPKNDPSLIEVGPVNYLAVRGKGDPNDESGEYKKSIEMLYPVAFTIRMTQKSNHKIDGFFEYVVPPLEGFWWQEGSTFDPKKKEGFEWISVIRLPNFVTKEVVEWAKNEAERKKKIDCSKVEFLTIDEGLCVQCMHIGDFDSECATIELMEDFIKENGYVTDINDKKKHHEIYMSDARRVDPDKWKTVIRLPIRKA